MPNTFGGYPLIDPRSIIENRTRFRRDLFPELRLANSYYSLSGRWPDVGWLLLDRRSYDSLNKYATTHELVIQDFVNASVTISNVSIVQAQCVTRGLASDPNAVYLIQVTNNLGVLYNPWFQMPVTAQYNVRVPAYPEQFYNWSLNGGTTWTWSTMVEDLWNRAPAQLGTYPGLPSAPAGAPENFIFIGVPLWSTIEDVLNSVGMTVVGEYPNLDIVKPGAADSLFTAQQSLYSKYLVDDLEYIDGGSGRIPSQVVVHFHRRNQHYGTEETVRYDSLNWQSAPSYTVTVASSEFSSAAGTGYLWDGFTVRYDQDGQPLAADVATANQIAAQRVTQFYDVIFRGTQGFMRQVYSGALPFSTGSLVDGVRWFNCAGERLGWHTEIIRGYAWEEATFPTNLEGLKGPI